MSRPLGYDRSVFLNVFAQSLLLTVVCRFLSLSLPLPVMPLMAVSGNFRFLSAGFCTEAHRRYRVVEDGFHL
jgi:hypothetical protein